MAAGEGAGPRSSQPCFSTFFVSAPSQNLNAKNIPCSCCVLYVHVERVSCFWPLRTRSPPLGAILPLLRMSGPGPPGQF